MKEVGGFLGLDLIRRNDIHASAIGFNTARNALKVLLEEIGRPTNNYLSVALPAFLCPDVAIMLKRSELKIKLEFYNIGNDLKPVLKDGLQYDVFYYYDVFGLVGPPDKMFATHTIVDSAHSFYQPPENGFHSIYSARKFLGVPDGALLYTWLPIENREPAESWQSSSHLLKRVDVNAETSYAYFLEAEAALSRSPALGISNLSRALIEASDTDFICKARRNNFEALHARFRGSNELSHLIDRVLGRDGFVPFMYPLLLPTGKMIRRQLIENRIYSPTLWSAIAEASEASDYEKHMSLNTVHLPVDQRYTLDDMNWIAGKI